MQMDLAKSGKMNQQLMAFEGQHEVMLLMKEDVNFDFNGDFLIRAKDVGTVLEYEGSNATKEILKFCKKSQIFIMKNSDISESVNRTHRKLNNAGEAFITTLALNRVFGKSEKPKAEPFQDWLYEEALPSIQKHGAYMTGETLEKALTSPDFLIELATKLKEEKQKRMEAEEIIQKQKPQVLFADAVTTSKSSILVGELAKILKQNGIDIGPNRLFKWLRENGYLIRR
jgi:anti-repressor protein